MTEFILHLLITTGLLLLIAKLASGVEIDSWWQALIAAIVLGLVNAGVRPIMVLMSLPLTIMTLGLSLLVINALMLKLTAVLVPGVRINGCIWALLGSIMLSSANFVIELVTGIG